MDKHESSDTYPPTQDPSALPPLFFEPEVDSDHGDSQHNSLENTPPDSNLHDPAKRNEPKLSLSSYQSVTSGEITPTRELTPVSFQDGGVDVTAEQAATGDLENVSQLKSPEIVSKQPNNDNDSTVVKQKTSTPIRGDKDPAPQTSCDMEHSSKGRSRNGNRVSFVQTDVIEPSDVRVPVTGFEVMEQRARFTVSSLITFYQKVLDDVYMKKDISLLERRMHFFM